MSGIPGLFLDFLLHPSFHRVVLWWGALAALGIAFLPLTLRLFRGFSDGGYLFSRVLGLLLTSYALWLASSLRLVPFSEGAVLASAGLAALINYSVPGSMRRVLDFLRKKRRVVAAEEYLFLLCLVGWTFLRSLRPELDSIEKFMDLGFLNACLRAEWMPPVDMWLSGRPINYYYFGHFFTAFLCRLTGTPGEIGFNLMVASLFSFAFTLSFSIVFSMLRRVDPQGVRKAVAGGLLAGMLLAGGGTLHPFVYGVALPALKNAGLYAGEVGPYRYWDATRFLGYHPPGNDKTIHEVPLFTFVLGEMHGHSLDIPASLAAVGIGSSMLLSGAPSPGVRFPATEIVSGVLLGATWMTNTWNYPIYLAVLAGAALTIALRRHGMSGRALAEAGLAVFTLILVSQAAALPYTLRFESFTGGIRRVAASSPIWQLGVLWGYQAFFAAVFAIFFVFELRRALRLRVDSAAGGGRALSDGITPSDIVGLGMFAAAVLLVAVPEIVYVKDLFSGEFPRANTVFKITYQAFLLFALASAYAAARIAGSLRSRARRLSAALLFALVAAMPMTYAYWAVPGFYGSPPSSGQYRRLDGLAFLSSGDRTIVEWFRGNVRGQPVILEADGDAYSRYGRISSATGLPTLLGWFGHQWLWRGGADEPNARRRDVRILYESGDAALTRRLAEAYGIRYIVIGTMELERFPDIRKEKLESMGRVVLTHADGSKIIEIAAP